MKAFAAILFLFFSGAAFAVCPAGIECVELEKNTVRCGDLRYMFSYTDAIQYGNRLFFSYSVLEDGVSMPQRRFCDQLYSSRKRPRKAQPVTTRDSSECPLWDHAFECVPKIGR